MSRRRGHSEQKERPSDKEAPFAVSLISTLVPAEVGSVTVVCSLRVAVQLVRVVRDTTDEGVSHVIAKGGDSWSATSGK